MASASRLRPLVLLAVLAVLAVLAGCGNDDEGKSGSPEDRVTTTDASTTTTTTTTTTARVETTSARIYLLRGEVVAPVRRDVDAASPARAAVEALIAGPEGGEADLTSNVPPSTRVLGVNIANGVATVDLSADFASGGGSLSMTTRVAQVVYTLTQFPTVTSVAFHLDGEPVEFIGGEGVMVDPPLTRADLEQSTPIILLDSPLPGDTLASPFVIEGTSNTFEAVYLVDLVDSTGRTLVDTSGTATSGTGTRGTFRQELTFSGAAPGPATLRVFESSAKDGSEINVVSITVII